MYPVFLGIHSWIRWLLLMSILLVLMRSVAGFRKQGNYGRLDQGLATLLFWTLNAQFLVGLAMYVFYSPYTHAAFSNLSDAMGNATLRFFFIEHPLAMFLAIGAGHSGLSKAKKVAGARQKHLQLLKGLGASLFFMLIGIPWPFLPYGRALFFM